MIAQLGNRYDDRPNVLAFEISFVGTWGEGHFSQAWLPPYDDPDATVPLPNHATQQWLIDLHYAHFVTTPLIGPVACADDQILTRTMFEDHGGAGIFMDCWGQYPSVPGGWSHMTVAYPQCLEHIHDAADPAAQVAWQKGMIKLEPCAGISTWTATNRASAFDWALEQHASVMHNQRDDLPPEALPDLVAMLKRLGYRLVLRAVEHPGAATAGTFLPIRLELENVGVAPPYRDYFLAVKLDNGQQQQQLITDHSVKHWAPGEHSTTIDFPVGLPPGLYTLSIAVVSPYDGTPKISFAIPGRQPSGWYPVNSVRVF
ncbi:DUF4832 domain-containing protein [Myxococcota bacterium]